MLTVIHFLFISKLFHLFPSLLALWQLARHSHTAVDYKGNMVIYGGELANGSLACDVWMYRPLRDDWQQLGFSNSRGAPKLANHATAVVDSFMYVFGGEFEARVAQRVVF